MAKGEREQYAVRATANSLKENFRRTERMEEGKEKKYPVYKIYTYIYIYLYIHIYVYIYNYKYWYLGRS